jgi:hypothetical protein
MARWPRGRHRRDHVLVIDRGVPVLVHAWLGALYRNREDELIGSINLDPGIRRARRNGSRDAEIVLEAPLGMVHRHY